MRFPATMILDFFRFLQPSNTKVEQKFTDFSVYYFFFFLCRFPTSKELNIDVRERAYCYLTHKKNMRSPFSCVNLFLLFVLICSLSLNPHTRIDMARAHNTPPAHTLAPIHAHTFANHVCIGAVCVYSRAHTHFFGISIWFRLFRVIPTRRDRCIRK